MKGRQALWSDLYAAGVVSSDEAALGRVGQVYLDDQTGKPSWISVVMERVGAEVLVPLDGAALLGGTLRVPFSSDAVRKAPRVGAVEHLAEEGHGALTAYYLQAAESESSSDSIVAAGSSKGHLWAAPVIREDDEGVRIEGMTGLEAQEALTLLRAAKELQYELGSSAAGGLLRALLVEANFELTPPAAVEQARRLAEVRQALMASPVYTNESLGKLRGDDRSSTTRTWISRMRKLGRMFTVRLDGRTVIPAFQLTDAGQPKPEFAAVLGPLLEAGVDGWDVWLWLTTSSPLLSGERPSDLVEKDVERVARAATRFAARRASAA